MTEPSRLAVAIGLAALGRQVLCARPWDEPTHVQREDIIREIGSAYGLVFYPETMRIQHEPSRGMVVIVNAGTWERAFGREYHHLIGRVHLRNDQRDYLQALCRLSV